MLEAFARCAVIPFNKIVVPGRIFNFKEKRHLARRRHSFFRALLPTARDMDEKVLAEIIRFTAGNDSKRRAFLKTNCHDWRLAGRARAGAATSVIVFLYAMSSVE